MLTPQEREFVRQAALQQTHAWLESKLWALRVTAADRELLRQLHISVE